MNTIKTAIEQTKTIGTNFEDFKENENIVTFSAIGFHFTLELESANKVKSLKVLHSEYATKAKTFLDKYGIEMKIEGNAEVDDAGHNYLSLFNLEFSCKKENFDLTELPSAIDELVKKFENFLLINYNY